MPLFIFPDGSNEYANIRGTQQDLTSFLYSVSTNEDQWTLFYFQFYALEQRSWMVLKLFIFSENYMFWLKYLCFIDTPICVFFSNLCHFLEIKYVFFKYKFLIVFYVVNKNAWFGSYSSYPRYLCYCRQLTNIDCKDLFSFSFLRKIHTNFYVDIWVQLFQLWVSKRHGSIQFFCLNFQDIILGVVPDVWKNLGG